MMRWLYDPSISSFQEGDRRLNLASLAIPKFFELISVQLIGTVNTLLLTGYLQAAVTAVSVANQVLGVMAVAITILTTGAGILVSYESGAGNRETVAKTMGSALLMAILSTLVIGIGCALCADPLMTWMQVFGDTHTMAAAYFSVKSAALVISALYSCFVSFLICSGYTKHALFLGILCNLLNAGFSALVIYGGWNLPFHTIIGVALSGVLAQLIAAVCGIWIFRQKKCPFSLCLSGSNCGRILRLGVPGAMNVLSWQASRTITTRIIAGFGEQFVNVHVYVNQIVTYVTYVGVALKDTNSIIMGRHKGQGDYDSISRLYRQNLRLALLSNFSLSVLAFLFHRQLISLFTQDAQQIALGGTLMLIDIAVNTFRAINHISESSLNANGDVRTVFVVSAFSCWFGCVGMAYILAVFCGLGLMGCWISFAVDEGIKVICYTVRWRSGKWKNVRV